MPAPKREYSRLYHDLVDDPMFADVYTDDGVFGLWSRLLIEADKAWPTSASLPLGVNKGRLQRLVTAGLVVVAGARFRVRGMDKERAARSDHGRRGADGRWHAPGDDEQSGAATGGDDDGMPPHPSSNASAMRVHPASIHRAMRVHPSGNAHGMPSKDEKRREETRQEEQEQSARSPDSLSDEEHVADAMAEASGLHFPVASRNGDRLMAMVKRSGLAAVLSTISLVSQDLGPYADQAHLVNRVADYLNAAPKANPVAVEDRAKHERRVEATSRRIAEYTTPPQVDEEVAKAAMAKARDVLVAK
jgi:hypothetical protein